MLVSFQDSEPEDDGQSGKQYVTTKKSTFAVAEKQHSDVQIIFRNLNVGMFEPCIG